MSMSAFYTHHQWMINRCGYVQHNNCILHHRCIIFTVSIVRWCRMSGFVVPGSKSDDHYSWGLKTDFTLSIITMLYILSVKIYISHFWIMDHVLFLYVKFIRGVSTGMLTSLYYSSFSPLHVEWNLTWFACRELLSAGYPSRCSIDISACNK